MHHYRHHLPKVCRNPSPPRPPDRPDPTQPSPLLRSCPGPHLSRSPPVPVPTCPGPHPAPAQVRAPIAESSTESGNEWTVEKAKRGDKSGAREWYKCSLAASSRSGSAGCAGAAPPRTTGTSTRRRGTWIPEGVQSALLDDYRGRAGGAIAGTTSGGMGASSIRVRREPLKTICSLRICSHGLVSAEPSKRWIDSAQSQSGRWDEPVSQDMADLVPHHSSLISVTLSKGLVDLTPLHSESVRAHQIALPSSWRDPKGFMEKRSPIEAVNTTPATGNGRTPTRSMRASSRWRRRLTSRARGATCQ